MCQTLFQIIIHVSILFWVPTKFFFLLFTLNSFSWPEKKQTFFTKLLYPDYSHWFLSPPTRTPPPLSLHHPKESNVRPTQKQNVLSQQNNTVTRWIACKMPLMSLYVSVFSAVEPRCLVSPTKQPAAGNVSAGLWSRVEDCKRRGFPPALSAASRSFDFVKLMQTNKDQWDNQSFLNLIFSPWGKKTGSSLAHRCLTWS